MADTPRGRGNLSTMSPGVGCFAAWLVEPINNITLVLFRITFGLLIFIEINKTWSARVEMISTKPIRFPYLGFEWVPLVPGSVAVIVHVVLAVACVGIAVGLWFRMAAIVFCLGYTYTFLVDRAYFNNHFYLICMLGGWLAVGDAHRRWSFDAIRFPSLASRSVPRWEVLGPAIQMALPYVFGGIAKINPDWLRGEPMRAMLWGLWDYPLYAGIVGRPWAGVVFAWAGLLFDLFIVPALLWPRTRLLAVVTMIFFHVTNMNMLDIGIFPWLGIGATVLFMPPRLVQQWLTQWSETLFGRRSSSMRALSSPLPEARCSPIVLWGFVAWFAVQAVLPFRHYLIPGNVGWTREGFYFAWTMKRDRKSDFVGFHVCDPVTGECEAIDHNQDLTFVQQYWMPGEPQGIVRYAKFLRERAISGGLQDPVIVCDSVSSLNGRPYQYMIDPSLDPSELTVPIYGHAPWIVPLNESAPIGNYKTGAAKEAAVMAVVEDVRLRRGIFPERLRGKRIVDVTPKE